MYKASPVRAYGVIVSWCKVGLGVGIDNILVYYRKSVISIGVNKVIVEVVPV